LFQKKKTEIFFLENLCREPDSGAALGKGKSNTQSTGIPSAKARKHPNVSPDPDASGGAARPPRLPAPLARPRPAA
jgi:hypothetical protein